jgi:hypothetical protein
MWHFVDCRWANETEKQAAEKYCLEYHIALKKWTKPLMRWNKILRKTLIEKINGF